MFQQILVGVGLNHFAFWVAPRHSALPSSSPPHRLFRLLACPFSLVSLLIFLSALIHGLRCLRRRNPNKSIFNAMRRTRLPVAPCSPPPCLSLSRSLPLLGSKCTVSVKGLSLISGQLDSESSRIGIDLRLQLTICSYYIYICNIVLVSAIVNRLARVGLVLVAYQL